MSYLLNLQQLGQRFDVGFFVGLSQPEQGLLAHAPGMLRAAGEFEIVAVLGLQAATGLLLRIPVATPTAG